MLSDFCPVESESLDVVDKELLGSKGPIAVFVFLLMDSSIWSILNAVWRLLVSRSLNINESSSMSSHWNLVLKSKTVFRRVYC